MSGTTIDNLTFEENAGFVSIDLIERSTGGSVATVDATILDFQDQGVMVDEDRGGTPKVIVRHLIPWSSIHRIYQDVS